MKKSSNNYIIPFDILVNKQNLIEPIDYKPNDLVIMDDNKNNFHKYYNPNQKPQISRSILKPFRKMEKAFNNHFKDIGSKLIVDSGYRSYDYQRDIYMKKVRKLPNEFKKIMALPGSSEHQTGLAFDIAFIKEGKYTDKTSDNDPEIIWLMENSWKYGFILRYPKDKEEITGYRYERWHYRFVGEKISKIIHENNLSLEEYHQIYKVKQKIR